jgi:hypothetical protein
MILNLAIGVMIVFIIGLVIFKFVLPKQSGGPFRFEEFEKISVTDLNGNEMKLSQLVSADEITYILILELTDCNSCILKGIDDLKRLKGAGRQCLCLVVNDLLNEVRGWSVHMEFSPFFAIKKVDFYEHVHTAATPVMVKIKDNEIAGFRFIKP